MNPNPDTQKSPQSLREENILLFWERENIFKKTLEKPAPMGDFVFFEGPPTANGRPGIHHMAARSFKDVIPRYKTMRGFNVRRKAGWDTHGLPVEIQAEKKLGLKSKKEIEEFGVAEFNKECRQSVWEYKDEWEQMTRRMGYWLDMSDPYITYNNSYVEALWGVVKKADERGHLYKDFRVVPWCTRCGTTLSSHELNQPGAYKDVKDLSVYVKFAITGGLATLARSSGHDVQPDAHQSSKPAYLVAWTTTPWTLPGNVALAVGADIEYVQVSLDDEMLIIAKERVEILPEGYEVIAEHKGSDLAGLTYEPLYPFLSEIANDEQKAKLKNAFTVVTADFVTTTDGTGIVHIAPMYGADDFEVGTKLDLPKVHTVAENGTFVLGTGFLEGRYVKEQDENGKPTLAVDIVNNLKERNLWFKQETYKHSYPHCWRCDTPLLYYAHRSWFFRMSALRDQLLAANEQINWEPKHVREGRFGEWLDGIKDWNISRDRFWGTPLPIWQTPDGETRVVMGSMDDVRTHATTPITKIIFVRHGQAEHNVLNMSSSALEKHPLTALGEQQAQHAAQQLLQHTVDVVIASPILRARQTADAYTSLTNASYILDERVGEIRSGDWEERTQDDPAVKEERDRYKALPVDERYTLKRGETGESWSDLDARIQGFLDDVLATHKGKTIAVFSHQGAISSALKLLNGIPNEDAAENLFYGIGNASISTVFVDEATGKAFDMHKPYIDALQLELNGKKLVRTPEVMDVWFDSGAMPFAQDHKLGEAMNFHPVAADYIAEGMDQTRGWFYTMHAIANMMHDTPTTAYKNVVCLGLILDKEGIKMSKSKGNVVNPWDMFDKYGADTIRFWMYSINQPGESKNFDEKTVDEVVKKVFNLLSNVVKFYDMFKDGDTGVDDYRQSPHVLDQWISALTDQLVIDVTESLDDYKPMEATRAIREYIAELSQWYIRRSRDRFKSDDVTDRAYALATTREVLVTVTKLMAPFTPFFAEDVYQQLKREGDAISVHLQDWPQAQIVNNAGILQTMKNVREVVSRALEQRAKLGIKVRQPLGMMKIKYQSNEIQNYPEFAEIIKDEVNVKDIQTNFETYENDTEGMVWLDTTITESLQQEGQFRELLRQIQDLRKTMGLEQADRVVMTVATSADGMALINQFRDELMKTAGITAITEGEGEHTLVIDDLTYTVTLAQ